MQQIFKSNIIKMTAVLILGLHPANERRRNFVTTSLIGWAQALTQPCDSMLFQGPKSQQRKNADQANSAAMEN